MGSSSLLLSSPLSFLLHHRASLRPSSLPLRSLHLRARPRGASLDPQPLPKPVSSSSINVYEEQEEVDEDEARGYTDDDDDDDDDEEDDDDSDEEEGRGYVGEEEDGGRGYVGEDEEEGEDDTDEEEGEDDTDEEEDGENKGEGEKISKRKGRRMRRKARKQAWREAEWMDCEDRILEDTVPLVGFIRMILHSGKYQSGQRLSPEHEKAIIERLLVHHPNYKGKIGCGIDYLTIGYHPDFHTSRCLFIVRKDGEFVDISFWKCLKNFIRTKYPLYADSFILRHFQRRKNYD